jgi:hypothetical protein
MKHITITLTPRDLFLATMSAALTGAALMLFAWPQLVRYCA